MAKTVCTTGTRGLLLLVIVQWILICSLLQHCHESKEVTPTLTSSSDPEPSSSSFQENSPVASSTKNDSSKKKIKGVLATVLFRAPRWMHLRYTTMIHNALANLPSDDWTVQVFLNRPWADSELLPWHPGLRRLLEDPRIIVTDLPANLSSSKTTNRKMKPKMVQLSSWFWDAMAADGVLLFSGNGAFCGNHLDSQSSRSDIPDPTMWNYLLENLDYVGAPWFRGEGGDGSTHSYRNRKAMLTALEFAKSKGIDPMVTGDTEYNFFLHQFSKMKKDGIPIRVASDADSQRFAGVYNLTGSDDSLQRIPLVASGTHARLQWGERESLLKHCPELKMIFPSLHEPSCFGAHPVGETCKATICALQENVPSHGC